MTIAPTFLPVSVAEAKTYCRYVGSDADADFERWINDAAQYFFDNTGVVLSAQTIALRMDCFPCSGDIITLHRWPVSAISSINYVDEDGVNQSLSSSLYVEDIYGRPARIAEAYNQSWPETRGTLNNVTVTIVAGYATAAAIPGNLKNLILTMVAWKEANRGDESPFTDMPDSLQLAIAMHRLPIFGLEATVLGAPVW